MRKLAFHSTFDPTFDVMFDDVQFRGGQTIEHFTEHHKALEMLDEMWSNDPTFQSTFYPTFDGCYV